MKHVQIIAFCDSEAHADDDRTPSVVERTISIDGGRPVELDLCESCDKVFTDMLMLMERGAPVDPTAQKRSPKPSSALPTVCAVCGFKSVTRQSLGQHVRAQHGKGLKQIAAEAKAGPEEVRAEG